MATPIRVIPTLHGEEARKFIERAEWVEAHGADKNGSKVHQNDERVFA